jgi:hypothetical protein
VSVIHGENGFFRAVDRFVLRTYEWSTKGRSVLVFHHVNKYMLNQLREKRGDSEERLLIEPLEFGMVNALARTAERVQP